MTPAQARQLLVIAERGSISSGARELKMTQPALSNALSAIEEKLALTLFVRSTRRLQPTPAFRTLKRRFERLVTAASDISAAVEQLKEQQGRTLHIGVSPVVDQDRVAQLFRRFETVHPGVEVEFTELNLTDLTLQLTGGALDLVIAPKVPGRARFKRLTLYREPLMLIQAGAKTAAPVELTEVQREAFLMVPDVCGLSRVTLGLFRGLRLKLVRSRAQPLGYHLLERWALEGRGAAIVPKSKVTGQAARPLLIAGASAQLEVLALMRRNETAPASLQQLVSVLRQSDSIVR